MLLGAGAAVAARDHSSRCPLHYASNSLEVTQLLLDYGADPNAKARKTHSRNTPGPVFHSKRFWSRGSVQFCTRTKAFLLSLMGDKQTEGNQTEYCRAARDIVICLPRARVACVVQDFRRLFPGVTAPVAL